MAPGGDRSLAGKRRRVEELFFGPPFSFSKSEKTCTRAVMHVLSKACRQRRFLQIALMS